MLPGRPQEIAVEISPYAYAYYANSPGPTFRGERQATQPTSFPLARDHGTSFAWPLRVGVGLFTGNTGGDVYAQLRVDVIGLMIRTRRFILDIHAPSFRYAILLERRRRHAEPAPRGSSG